MSLEQLLAHVSPGSPEDTLARQLKFDRLPAHVAVIMDGNGRWAAQRHLPRVEGHRAGIDAVRDIVETSARLGIQVLTLYAFSVENWKRPAAEVASYLYTAGQPDPDLLIRTSGEMRVSNFLLWQIAYAEIWVTDTLWPDFRARHLLDAIVAYQKRDRRYGGITQPVVAGR